MPTYCIKTSDIPAENLPLWYEAQQQLEGDFASSDWPKYIFSYDYVYLKTDYEPLLIGSYVSPSNPLPLTLSILKQLAFLKLTGDCNDNNTLSLSSTAED